MVTRNRKKKAMAKTRMVARDEAPREELHKLAQSGVVEVQVKISRVTAGSRRVSCGHENWPTHEIYTEKFEKWISDMFGGGAFIIDVYNMEDAQRFANVPPFRLNLEGEPKMTPGQQVKFNTQAQANAARGLPPPNPQQYVMQGGPPVQADGRVYGGNNQQPFNPRDYWNTTPDDAFKQQAMNAEKKIEDLEKQRDADRREREKDREKWEQRDREWVQRLTEIENKHRDEREASKQKELEARLDLLKDQSAQKKDVDWAALVTAAIPLVTAYMTTAKDREARQQDQQFKSLEIQQKSADNVLKLMGNKAASETEALKAIMPMITKAMSDKSPAAQATLLESVGATMSQQISLIHQIIQANQPDNPPWLPVVEQTLEGLASVANAFVTSQRASAESAPVKAIASAIQPTQPTQPDTQPPQQQDESQQGEAQWTTAEEIATICMQSPHWPVDMRTPEWYQLLIIIHSTRDVEETASALFDHLENLSRLNTLPETFAEIWTKPDTILADWVAMLPIAQQNNEHAQNLVSCFTNMVLDAQEQEPEVVDTPDKSGNNEPAGASEVSTKEPVIETTAEPTKQQESEEVI